MHLASAFELLVFSHKRIRSLHLLFIMIIVMILILLFLILILIVIYQAYIIKKGKKEEKEKGGKEGGNTDLVYPNHIAFIMDGNGRWAKQQQKERSFGHLNGANNLHDIFYNCFANGSNFLTFYVFSEQNWKRSPAEIKNIFDIIYDKLKLYSNQVMKYRIIVQGKLDKIPKKLKKLLLLLQKETEDYEKTIILCLDYSGRSEILNACKNMIENKVEPTMDNFCNNLYLKGIPDPDLIIRTSGEKRISDFLLWQLSYSEFYFTDVYWPDFDIKELKKAIREYNSRQRRYGAAS
jgi:undecaprenyl diphosphate synthase